MGVVKDKVRNLVQMLDSEVEEAKILVETMHNLQDYLEEKSKSIIQANLNRLLNRIRAEAAKITTGRVVVLVSPEGVVTVDKTYSDEGPDSYLMRLKSQGFYIWTLPEFSHFIHSLEAHVAEGSLISVIKFLMATARVPSVYSPASPIREAEQPREPSPSSKSKISDWLPMPPWEGPPLPRRLFKD